MTTPAAPDTVEVLLARIDTKLDVVIARAEDHETRLRQVERRLFALPGLAALLATASLVVAIFHS